MQPDAAYAFRQFSKRIRQWHFILMCDTPRAEWGSKIDLAGFIALYFRIADGDRPISGCLRCVCGFTQYSVCLLRDSNPRTIMETTKQKNSTSESMSLTSTVLQGSADFDNWAIAVRAQLLASLRKRGGRF